MGLFQLLILTGAILFCIALCNSKKKEEKTKLSNELTGFRQRCADNNPCNKR